jgi:hypothetical protein
MLPNSLLYILAAGLDVMHLVGATDCGCGMHPQLCVLVGVFTCSSTPGRPGVRALDVVAPARSTRYVGEAMQLRLSGRLLY